MKSARLFIAICVAVAAVASAGGGFPAGAQTAGKIPASPVSVTTESHGLRITLSAPQATYPMNSLVLTTIRVKNVSARTVSILGGGCPPTIRMVVLDKKGQPYPPPVNFYPPSCGPSVPPTALKPGGFLRQTSLVVLPKHAPLEPTRRMDSGYTAHTAFTFSPTPVSANAVAESQAAAEARLFADAFPSTQIPANINESVFFGHYSSPAFLTRLVWLVVYSGPGVNIAVDTIHRIPGVDLVAKRTKGISSSSYSSPPVVHQEAIAVDAATGQFMEDSLTTDMPVLPASQ